MYEDIHLFKKVSHILEKYPNVILQLPTEDKDQSMKILSERTDFEHNDLFVYSSCNEKLAKIVVYTEGKSPEETCDEVIKMMK